MTSAGSSPKTEPRQRERGTETLSKRAGVKAFLRVHKGDLAVIGVCAVLVGWSLLEIFGAAR